MKSFIRKSFWTTQFELIKILWHDFYSRSAIAILAKAEALAEKLNAERWGDSHHLWSEETRIDEYKETDFGPTQIGNKDWKLKIADGEKDWDFNYIS